MNVDFLPSLPNNRKRVEYNPQCRVLIKYEEDVLEYVTRRPGLLTGDAILDNYEESFKKPLELWNGNKKVS